jgi:four helix bundle protein
VIRVAVNSRQSAVGSQQSAVSRKNLPSGSFIHSITCHLQNKFDSKSLLMSNYKDLLAFRKAFALAMKIFEISRRFPKDETYSLTDQIRRSSRSVCVNFAEAFRKRKYPAYFLSKLSDSDAENSETDVWLDFAFSCKYINGLEYKELTDDQNEVGRLIGDMLKNPQKYL